MFQGLESDYLYQTLQLVYNEDRELIIGVSNVEVTGNLDENSFRRALRKRPGCIKIKR